MTFHDGLLDAYDGAHPWLQTVVRVVLVALVGYVAIRLLRAWVDAALKRPALLDQTARLFLVRVVYAFSWVALAAAVLATAGADVAALLGGLAIGGFIVGFALKDTLANLASGIILLVYRPFNVGDIVTLGGGQTGKVQELGMALTVLQQFDGRIVTVPNGTILDDAILNHTRNPVRRVEARFQIDYDDDIDAAVRALSDMLAADPACLEEPAPEVVVVNITDNAVELEVRAWARVAEFGALINGVRPNGKRALEQAGCRNPMPQREVHLHAAPPDAALGAR